MAIAPLLSHSDGRLLVQHLQEVSDGAQQLLGLHDPMTQAWLGQAPHTAGALHDLGKATREFQQYIADPSHYPKAASTKTHAGISSLLALSMLQNASHAVEPAPTAFLNALEFQYRIAWAISSHHQGLLGFHDWIGSLSDMTYELTIADSANPSLRERVLQGIWDALAPVPNLIHTWSKMTQDFTETIPLYDWLQKQLIEPIGLSHHRCYTQKFRSLVEPLPVEATHGRLWLQSVFSLLLEADRLYLALAHPDAFLNANLRPSWTPTTITQSFHSATTPLHDARTALQTHLQQQLAKHPEDPLYQLTVPTGLGKTALAALWALTLQHRTKSVRPIIIVLPYLSLIDQTVQVWQHWEHIARATEDPSLPWVAAYSGSSTRNLPKDPFIEESDWPFYLDTWYSPVTITTYDQLLLTLFDPSPAHQLRFHKLLDAYLICDEVQSLPTTLWEPFRLAIEGITRYGGTRALMMSATLPEIFPQAVPLIPPDTSAIHFTTPRYQFTWDLAPRSVSQWAEELPEHVRTIFRTASTVPPRIAITVNQRRTAKMIFKALQPIAEALQVPLYLISADVTPRDRRHTIAHIKRHQGDQNSPASPCIAVTTQTIEAGVDLDFTHIYRDFAPWDRLVQIAGRANRENQLTTPASVHIVNLLNRHSDRITQASAIYPKTECRVTEEFLRSHNQPLTEVKVSKLSQQYFALLQEYKNTGRQIAHQWYVEESTWDHSVAYYLRGAEDTSQQCTFLDIESLTPDEQTRVATLVTSIQPTRAHDSTDRWKRRETMRTLDALLRDVTVTIRQPKEEHLSSIGSLWNATIHPDWYVFYPDRYIRTTANHPATGFQYAEDLSLFV